MLVWTFVLFANKCQAGVAQQITTTQPWRYLLLDESDLLDDCPLCDRATIQEAMRGTFNLRLLQNGPLFTLYALQDIDFKAGPGRNYSVTGSGTWKIGGEVAVFQEMFLQVLIDNGSTKKLCYFTNSSQTVTRPWPMMDITLLQTNGTVSQLYTLRLAAAPVREIWFSTASFFTASSGPSASNTVEGGDLLSISGRVVKRNSDLFTSVGAFPPAPDLGLDAVDMLPGGEIAFSLARNITSQTLGPLQHGDLLSNKGRILRRNQDLLAAFLPLPAGNDVGLDAVQVLDDGQILFSIVTNVFSKQLGVMLHRGDLLSSTGRVVQSNQQLLARFHPASLTNDYGLDALYIWPSGEIWFSTEIGFQDQMLGSVLGGDLLSDQGYIVLRNPDLLAAFAPNPNALDFGLDALYVITDATPPAAAPRLSVTANSSRHSLGLTWQSQGRVFQVDHAALVNDLYQPLSPIIPDLFFDEAGALTNGNQGYYRLGQW